MSNVRGRFVRQRTNPIQELPDISSVVALWLSNVKASNDTKAGYMIKLSPFVDWYGTRSEFSRDDVLGFVDSWLAEQGHSDKNRFEVVRRCKQFFRWLFVNGYTPDHNIALWFPAVEVDRQIRPPATLAQIAAMIDAAGKSELPERDQALLAVFLGTGVRRNEAANLRIEDVTMDASGAGSVIVRKAKKVKGRDVHQRVVAFDAETGFYLCRWLDRYDLRSGWLFPAWTKLENRFVDKPLSNRRINRIVDAISKRAGVDSVNGCHDLRRLFVTYWRQQHGQNHDHLLTLQVGHTNASMTDHYDLSGIERIKNVVVSPMSVAKQHLFDGS